MGDARGAGEPGGGGHVRFVDLATGAERAARLDFNNQVPIGVAFSPDGEVFAVTVDNNLVYLYDAGTHKRIGKPLENVDSPMLSATFAPDSVRLATGTGSGLVLQWNVHEQKVIEPPLEGDEGVIGGVAYSPDGKILATSRGGFSTTQLWRADHGARFDSRALRHVPFHVWLVCNTLYHRNHPADSKPAAGPPFRGLWLPAAASPQHT